MDIGLKFTQKMTSGCLNKLREELILIISNHMFKICKKKYYKAHSLIYPSTRATVLLSYAFFYYYI